MGGRDEDGKRLQDIRGDFERGVFLAVYRSRKQKMYRMMAAVILALRHSLRGLLFSWPLYLLALAARVLPQAPLWLFLLLLLPAVWLSWWILSRGIREDYANLIDGYILRSGFAGRMFFQGKR